MMMATFFFALMNVCIKQLSHIPPMEVVFFRCFIALAIAGVSMRIKHIDWIGSERKLLILRGVSGTLAVYTFFITLQRMPLATAVTIQYLSPIFTTIIAGLILGEYIPKIQYLFFAVSFAGIIVLKGFDTSITMSLFLIGLTSALCSGAAYNFVRTLKGKENPLVVVFHFQLIGAITGLCFTLFNYHVPTLMDSVYLLLVGIFTYLGQLYLTKALQGEAVGVVSSINYLGVVYAFIFGILIFNEHYTVFNYLGVALILTGVLLSIFLGKKQTIKDATA